MYAGRVCIIPELDLNPLRVESLEPKPALIISWVGSGKVPMGQILFVIPVASVISL